MLLLYKVVLLVWYMLGYLFISIDKIKIDRINLFAFCMLLCINWLNLVPGQIRVIVIQFLELLQNIYQIIVFNRALLLSLSQLLNFFHLSMLHHKFFIFIVRLTIWVADFINTSIGLLVLISIFLVEFVWSLWLGIRVH